MPNSKDRKTEAIILKWVKLRESDVIVKMIDPGGCLVEGVAKGARKPNNSSSSKLEPFNCVEVLLAKGKGLDIVRDSKTLQKNMKLREDPCKFACASCLGELLCKTLQPDIDVAKMYGLTKKYLSVLGCAPDSKRFSLTAAAILKASSYLGFMPSFNTCVGCGKDVDCRSNPYFSHEEGGAVCAECRWDLASVNLGSDILSVANSLLHATLEEVVACDIDDQLGADILRFACFWVKVQAGINLRSYPLALDICAC